MTDSAADLADRITDLVCEHWRNHGAPLLLSQLGSADQGAVGRRAKDISHNLAAFIKDHAADRVRIASGSANPLVSAAVPADVEEDIAVDDLIARSRERSATAGTRFHPAFWAAFRVPLEAGNRRFVSTHAPIRFEDLCATTEGQPKGSIEVEPQYVAETECEDRDVQQRITNWLIAHELDSAKYLASTKSGFDLPHNDVLGHMLLALSADDLKRMTIPLDIVGKLRRRSV